MKSEEGGVNEFIIKANAQEAMLIDWVLTMHSYDSDYLDYLMKPDIQQLRYQAGRVILDEHGELDLFEDEVKWLLAILPVTFRFGKEDVGFSLKKKLFEAFLGKRSSSILEEVKNASKDETRSETESGATTEDFSFPSRKSMP